MTKDTMKEAAVAAGNLLFNDWVDVIEDGVRSLRVTGGKRRGVSQFGASDGDCRSQVVTQPPSREKLCVASETR